MLVVPENNIYAIAFDPKWQKQEYVDMIFEPLKNKNTRSWFVDHAYHCLPLVIGNQYGFAIKSIYDFEVTWSGGDAMDDVVVNILTPKEEVEKIWTLQIVSAHFGMGTFTVQMPFQLRTSPGVNLMTTNPPNYFIDGIYHMTGVVEADNLRRDFTYNLRITRPNYTIKINKGDYIGCVMPYPRHFIDKYSIKNASDVIDEISILEERKCMNDFGIERSTVDVYKKARNGKRYWRGEDVYGNKFADHQTNLDK